MILGSSSISLNMQLSMPKRQDLMGSNVLVFAILIFFDDIDGSLQSTVQTAISLPSFSITLPINAGMSGAGVSRIDADLDSKS